MAVEKDDTDAMLNLAGYYKKKLDYKNMEKYDTMFYTTKIIIDFKKNIKISKNTFNGY